MLISKKPLFITFFCAVMTICTALGVMFVTPKTVFADQLDLDSTEIEYYAFDNINNTRYLDKVSTYQVVTPETKKFYDEFYVVKEDVTINERIDSVGYNPTLILCDGATLTVKGGISIIGGNLSQNSITITGQVEDTGSLIITDVPENCPGIGGDSVDINTILICGGNINVTGGYNGAGIGSSDRKVHDIIIAGGTVTAYGGKLGAGIGTGGDYDGSFNNQVFNICFYGGIVNAIGGEKAPGIGGGSRGEAVFIFFEGGEVYSFGGKNAPGVGNGLLKDGMLGQDGFFKKFPYVIITDGLIESTGGGDYGAFAQSEKYFDDFKFANDNDDMTIRAGNSVNHFFKYTKKQFLNDKITLSLKSYVMIKANDFVPKGTNLTEYYCYDESTDQLELAYTADFKYVTSETTVLDGGIYVVKDNVEVNERITVQNDPILILRDDLGAGLFVAGGIGVCDGGSLTITGQRKNYGSLFIADVESGNAGIGGTGDTAIKNIIINGGDIYVKKGGEYGAGIGSGKGGSVEHITLNGGTINTTGGKYAPGIGSGYLGGDTQIEFGNVNLRSIGGESACAFKAYEQQDCNLVFNKESYTLCFGLNLAECKRTKYDLATYLEKADELKEMPYADFSYSGKDDEVLSVTFVINNIIAKVKIVERFDTIEKPTDLVRNGFTLGDWYLDSECTIPFDFDNPIMGSIMLFAIKTPDHTHNCVKHDGNPATESVAGWHEYYYCDICDTYFEDEACEKEIGNGLDLALWKNKGGAGYIAPTGSGESKPSDDNGLSVAMKVLISTCVVVLCGVGIAIYFFVIKKKKNQ